MHAAVRAYTCASHICLRTTHAIKLCACQVLMCVVMSHIQTRMPCIINQMQPTAASHNTLRSYSSLFKHAAVSDPHFHPGLAFLLHARCRALLNHLKHLNDQMPMSFIAVRRRQCKAYATEADFYCTEAVMHDVCCAKRNAHR